MSKIKWILVAIGVIMNLVAGNSWGWKIMGLIVIIGTMELTKIMNTGGRRRANVRPMRYGR